MTPQPHIRSPFNCISPVIQPMMMQALQARVPPSMQQSYDDPASPVTPLVFQAGESREPPQVPLTPAKTTRRNAGLTPRSARRPDHNDATPSCGSVLNARPLTIAHDPNRNPFSPFRGVMGGSAAQTCTPHASVIAFANNVPTPHPSCANTPMCLPMGAEARGGGDVPPQAANPRYSFRHYVPWLDEWCYIPLHQDVNGTVWLTTNMVDGLPYAVKEVLLNAGPLEDETAMLCLSKCSEFIVRYHCISAGDQCRLLQMEYCPKGCLCEHWLSRESMPSEGEIRKVMEHVFQGLDVLHAHRYVHGNLHPINLYVDAFNTIKLGNFGAGKQVNSMKDIPIGALPSLYEPPSDSVGETPFTRDVYSFTVGLIHLLWQCMLKFKYGSEQLDDKSRVNTFSIASLAQETDGMYSNAMYELLEALVCPVQGRLTPSDVVIRLVPPSPLKFRLLRAYEEEAASLRKKVERMQKRDSPLTCAHAEPHTPLGCAESSPLLRSCHTQIFDPDSITKMEVQTPKAQRELSEIIEHLVQGGKANTTTTADLATALLNEKFPHLRRAIQPLSSCGF